MHLARQSGGVFGVADQTQVDPQFRCDILQCSQDLSAGMLKPRMEGFRTGVQQG